MYKSSAMLGLTLLASIAQAAPMLATDVCFCEPLQQSTYSSPTYNTSLASCTRVAQSLEHWRGSDYKIPNYGEEGIEYRALQMSKTLGLESSSVKERHRLEIVGDRSRPQSLFPWNMEKQAEPILAKREAATYLRSADKFRILCQPVPTYSPTYTGEGLQWAVVTFLMIAMLWLCIFELAIHLYIRISTYLRAPLAEGTIVLIGDEKPLLAANQDLEPAVDE